MHLAPSMMKGVANLQPPQSPRAQSLDVTHVLVVMSNQEQALILEKWSLNVCRNQ